MANTQIGLIGRKLGMTQIFEANGMVHGVTVIQVEPNTILRVKGEKDGYAALQLGYGTKKDARATKAELGVAKAAGAEHASKLIREVRVSPEVAAGYTAGGSITAPALFKANDKLDVRGTSKGKGFAGVMKRHNFSGFKRSHGVHEYYRHGGSIGTRLTPGMTLKGVKMPGHMGNERTTVQNLKLVKLEEERNLLYVRGGVPGPVGGYVIVRKAAKVRTPRKK